MKGIHEYAVIICASIAKQEIVVKYILYLGDAATAFTKAVLETWGQGVTRLMCWAHTSRAIEKSKYLAAIRALDKKVAGKIMEDLYLLQWSVLNENSFMTVFGLLESKHTFPNFPELDGAVRSFFQYLRSVLVESEERRWYEGAHPYAPGHNQSVEGINRSIKANHTFRIKLPMGELFMVTLRLVKELSQVGENEILLKAVYFVF